MYYFVAKIITKCILSFNFYQHLVELILKLFSKSFLCSKESLNRAWNLAVNIFQGQILDWALIIWWMMPMRVENSTQWFSLKKTNTQEFDFPKNIRIVIYSPVHGIMCRMLVFHHRSYTVDNMNDYTYFTITVHLIPQSIYSKWHAIRPKA